MSYDASFSTNSKIKPCTYIVVCANRFIVGYETVYVENMHVPGRHFAGFFKNFGICSFFQSVFSLLIGGFCLYNDKVTGTCTYFTTLIYSVPWYMYNSESHFLLEKNDELLYIYYTILTLSL